MITQFNVLICIIIVGFTFFNSTVCKAQYDVPGDVKFDIYKSIEERESPKYYALADSVIMRKCASSDCAAVAMLSIGESFFLLERGMYQTLNGIMSHWYKVKTAQYTGWIWGGFIAKYAFGSEADSNIKFVAGLHHIEHKDGLAIKHYQIRACINQQQLDKLVFESFTPDPFWTVETRKAPSLPLNDIITFGSYSGASKFDAWGQQVVFWDGNRFHFAAQLINRGSYMAKYQSEKFIYPTDMEGIAGYVIKVTKKMINIKQAEATGLRKIEVNKSYYRCKGGRLIPSDKKTETIHYEVSNK